MNARQPALCPKVPTDLQMRDPSHCSVRRRLADGTLHKCKLNAGHHDAHRCFCDEDYR